MSEFNSFIATLLNVIASSVTNYNSHRVISRLGLAAVVDHMQLNKSCITKANQHIEKNIFGEWDNWQ